MTAGPAGRDLIYLEVTDALVLYGKIFGITPSQAENQLRDKASWFSASARDAPRKR